MVAVGVDRFVAQLVAHVLGVAFNYFTYSRHVFRDSERPVHRFVGAYVVNYFVNLAFLWAFSRFVASPYLAGALATLGASLLNYLLLKHAVFTAKRETA